MVWSTWFAFHGRDNHLRCAAVLGCVWIVCVAAPPSLQRLHPPRHVGLAEVAGILCLHDSCSVANRIAQRTVSPGEETSVLNISRIRGASDHTSGCACVAYDCRVILDLETLYDCKINKDRCFSQARPQHSKIPHHLNFKPPSKGWPGKVLLEG